MTASSRAEALLGQLAKDMEKAVSRVAGVGSAQARLVAATGALALLRRAQDAMAVARDSAIIEMVVAGSTYAQLSELSGLTRGRLSQIVRSQS